VYACMFFRRFSPLQRPAAGVAKSMARLRVYIDNRFPSALCGCH